MATMTGSDTDKRLDDLRAEMHRGFDRVETDCREIRAESREIRSDMKAGFNGIGEEIGASRSASKTECQNLRFDMKAGFDRVDADYRELRAEMKAGFDSVHKMMIRFFAGTLGSIVAGVILLFVTHH